MLLLVLYEVLSPKIWSIKAIPQAWKYFNPGSQAGLWHMPFDWAHVQRSTVGWFEQREDDVKKHQYSPEYCLPNFLHRFLAGARYSCILRIFLLPYLLTCIATLLIGSVLYSMQNNQVVVCSHFIS